MNSTTDIADRLLPARSVWERYAVSYRTLDNWIASHSMNFPKPVVLNRRRYFRLADLVAWEQKNTDHDKAA